MFTEMSRKWFSSATYVEYLGSLIQKSEISISDFLDDITNSDFRGLNRHIYGDMGLRSFCDLNQRNIRTETV